MTPIVANYPASSNSLQRLPILRVLRWIGETAVKVLIPIVAIDSWFYGKLVIAPLSILRYNLTVKEGAGAQLYGTEPWYSGRKTTDFFPQSYLRHFYILNAILNWNVVFLLALLAPVALVVRVLLVKLGGQSLPSLGQDSGLLAFPVQPLLYMLPLHLWLAIMSATPHKEERFLFPVYPLIALSAAFLLECELVDLAWAFGTRWAYRLVHLLLLLTTLLSISRITSLHMNYRAPLTMYHYLSEFELRRLPDHEPAQVTPPYLQVHICVGKEWYRFSSHYFLPSERFVFHFIESSFSGQLPQPFSPAGAHVQQAGFNDLNKGSADRFAPVAVCDYLLDLDFEEQTEPHYVNQSGWTVAARALFLDAAKSPNRFQSLTQGSSVPFGFPIYPSSATGSITIIY
jgi:alpha-1,2-mannosyltransferase